jgi:hypothetical protein
VNDQPHTRSQLRRRLLSAGIGLAALLATATPLFAASPTLPGECGKGTPTVKTVYARSSRVAIFARGGDRDIWSCDLKTHMQRALATADGELPFAEPSFDARGPHVALAVDADGGPVGGGPEGWFIYAYDARASTPYSTAPGHFTARLLTNLRVAPVPYQLRLSPNGSVAWTDCAYGPAQASRQPGCTKPGIKRHVYLHRRNSNDPQSQTLDVGRHIDARSLHWSHGRFLWKAAGKWHGTPVR